MKQILSLVLALLFCLSLCACDTNSVTDDKTTNESLKKYGEEFADFDNPAQEIAWSLVQVLNDELQINGIDLNSSEFDLEQWGINTDISEFDEELDVCAICCQPELISSGEFWGAAWIRVAWSSKTQELRNIFITSNITQMDNEMLIQTVFHNSALQGIGEVYDTLKATDPVDISWYNIRMKDNVVLFEHPAEESGVTYNIDFLLHSVYEENGEIYFSNGKRVSIDSDWLFNPVG